MQPKSIAITVLFAVAVYAPVAIALECYKCDWTEKDCATSKLAKDTKKEVCGSAAAAPAPGHATTAAAAAGGAAAETTAAPALRHFEDPPASAAPAAPVAPGAAGAANATNNAPSGKFWCYMVEVKDDKDTWVQRGCKTTDKTDDCVKIDSAKHPKATAGKCTVCDKDKCNNGATSITAGVSMHCALLSAMAVAILFFQEPK